MNCEITNAANAESQAPRVFCVLALAMWQLKFCCINEKFSLKSTSYMLVPSCMNFYKNILYINVFIIILKVAG